MNKYTVRGIAEAAAEGRTFLVVHPRQADTRTFLAMCDRPDTSRVVNTNGQERIEYPGGGYIRFTTPLSRSHRGLQVDTVYLDQGLADDPALVAELLPAATRELVRA